MHMQINLKALYKGIGVENEKFQILPDELVVWHSTHSYFGSEVLLFFHLSWKHINAINKSTQV